MNDSNASAIFKKLHATEKQKRTWKRITSVHHKPKAPLLSLLVPSSDRPGSYDHADDKAQIHKHLLERNRQHLKAASTSTLLQRSEGFPASTELGTQQPAQITPSTPPPPLSTAMSSADRSSTEIIPADINHPRHLFLPPPSFPLLRHLLSNTMDFDFSPLTQVETEFLKTIDENKTNSTIDPIIHSDDLKSILKVTNELTSSSPSGRHYGLYKAILTNETLLHIHTTMLSLPFKHGFILSRWKQVTQIMLLKKNRPWIDKLRIIELFEADYNTGIKLLLRRLLWHQQKSSITQEGTYGSVPGAALRMKRCLFAYSLSI